LEKTFKILKMSKKETTDQSNESVDELELTTAEDEVLNSPSTDVREEIPPKECKESNETKTDESDVDAKFARALKEKEKNDALVKSKSEPHRTSEDGKPDPPKSSISMGGKRIMGFLKKLKIPTPSSLTSKQPSNGSLLATNGSDRKNPDVKITANSIDQLDEESRQILDKAGIPSIEIEKNWGLVLAILQFCSKTPVRYENEWKDKKKGLTPPTGRDFRGSIEDLVIENQDPNKVYKLSKEKLGSGGFGVVYAGKTITDSTPVAIKKLPHVSSKQQRENLWEVGLTKACQCENVVTLIDAYVYESELWMICEQLEGGSLADAVALSGGFKEPHVAYAAMHVLRALVFLHDHNFVHRDLKSANLMFTLDAQIKLIDFGLCRDVSRCPGCTMLGSPFWMPPEMCLYEPHAQPADIWSCSISLLEMINGKPPHRESPVLAMFTTATKGIDLSQWRFSDELTDFLQQSLHYDPKQRATAHQLLKHKFLSKADSVEDMQRLLRQIFVTQAIAL